MWTCPACDATLTRSTQNWLCENGHHYDQAKEGYINLLLAQHKRSKDPGDNKEMVNARRAFLEAGFYQPMADSVAGLIDAYCPQDELNIFDAGCGEGYYLNRIAEISQEHQTITGCGIDVSKPAIQKAAKKYKSLNFAVGSSFQIPLENDWANAVIQIFAPSGETEIRRVMQEKGVWIQVNPGPAHLDNIKRLIYDNVQQHKANAQVPTGFKLVEEKNCTFEFGLGDPQSRLNLLKMTPYYWTAPEHKVRDIEQNLTQVNADFSIQVWQKD